MHVQPFYLIIFYSILFTSTAFLFNTKYRVLFFCLVDENEIVVSCQSGTIVISISCLLFQLGAKLWA